MKSKTIRPEEPFCLSNNNSKLDDKSIYIKFDNGIPNLSVRNSSIEIEEFRDTEDISEYFKNRSFESAPKVSGQKKLFNHDSEFEKLEAIVFPNRQ